MSNNTSASRLVVRARWGETTLDAIVSDDRRVPLAPELTVGAANRWLTSPADGGVTLHVPADGRAVARGTDDLAPGDHALAYGESATLVCGRLTFDVGWTTAADALGRDDSSDAEFARVLGMTAVMHGVLVAAALGTPRQAGLDGGISKHAVPPISVIFAPPKKPKPAVARGGAPAPKPAGAYGARERAPRKSAPPKDVRDTGLLALLNARSSAASIVLARGGMSDGLANALAGLDGAQAADAGGAGGLATRGVGPGGGGGPLDIGGFGGPGGRGPGGPGDGNIELGRGRGPRGPTVGSGKRIEVANISKDEIGRVIRRNLSRFKHCYDKELNANPNLAGKVSVYFTIAPTGRVASSLIAESTIESETIESCVRKVMESLTFPQPQGGGMAVVTYPFIFSSTSN